MAITTNLDGIAEGIPTSELGKRNPTKLREISEELRSNLTPIAYIQDPVIRGKLYDFYENGDPTESFCTA